MVNSIGLTLTLDYDAFGSPTNLTSTQTIFIPESALVLLGVALAAPMVVGARRRRVREILL